MGHSGDGSTGHLEGAEPQFWSSEAPGALLGLDDPSALRRTVTGPGRRRRAIPWPAVLRTGAVAAVIAGFVAVITVTRDGPQDGSGMYPNTIAGTAGTTAALLSCPSRREGAVIVGNGPGGTESGVEAILGFQYAFYSGRSGVDARMFVDPEAVNMSTSATIQRAIDTSIPVGTAHCVRITQVTAALFEVDLAEHRPDGITTVYRQRVATITLDGRHLIHSVDDR